MSPLSASVGSILTFAPVVARSSLDIFIYISFCWCLLEMDGKREREKNTPMRKHTCPYHLTLYSDYQNLWISLIRGVYVFLLLSFLVRCRFWDDFMRLYRYWHLVLVLLFARRRRYETLFCERLVQNNNDDSMMQTHAHDATQIHERWWFPKIYLRTPSERKLWEEHLKPDFM